MHKYVQTNLSTAKWAGGYKTQSTEYGPVRPAHLHVHITEFNYFTHRSTVILILFFPILQTNITNQMPQSHKLAAMDSYVS